MLYVSMTSGEAEGLGKYSSQLDDYGNTSLSSE